MKAQPWTIGPITIQTTDGPAVIPGWHNGIFSLDWRASYEPEEFGYQVTHVPTGLGVVAVLRNVEEVQRFVDKLVDLGDWGSATTRDACRELINDIRPAILALFDEVDAFDPGGLIAPAGHHGWEAFGNA